MTKNIRIGHMRQNVWTKCVGTVVGLAAAVAGLSTSDACVISLPTSSPGNEIEIEQEFEGYDSSSDRVRYKIEIEVELFSPTSALQCSCALNLGSTAVTAPTSFDVTGAIVGLRGGSEVDLIPFDGFSRDSAVESEMAGLPDSQAGSTPFGFSLDVSPFSVPQLNQGDLLALIFEIEFDPDDFDLVNGNSIQFAAGSADASHPLNIFQGYQATLNLPSFGLIPEPTSLALLAGFGLMTTAARSRKQTG